MASSSKKKTTMAKLMRESRLRERRLDKQARKDARKHASANGSDLSGETQDPTTADSAQLVAGEPSLEPVVHASPDA